MRALGLDVGKRDIGGIAFSGGSSALYRANLWLRTATRVIARVGDFHARLFDELERHSRKLAWARFLDAWAARAAPRVDEQVAALPLGRGRAAHRRGDGEVDGRRADGDEWRR